MTDNNWKLVDSFFDKYDLVDHHIKSYNDFVNNRIQKIIDISEPIVIENDETDEKTGEIKKVKYTVKTGQVTIRRPFTREADGSNSDIYPTDARLRNLNYSAHMYLDMALNKDDEDNPLEKVYIGELPVMLKSDYCYLNGLSAEELLEHNEDPQDLGGYFIVNGSERAVVTMEEIAPNKVILERVKEIEDRHAKAVVTSIRSGFRARITLEYKKPRKNKAFLRVSFPYVPGEIPLVILLRALGLSTDEQIITKISESNNNFQMIIADDIKVSEEALKLDPAEMQDLSIEERNEYLTTAAIKYIGNRVAFKMSEDYRIQRAEEVIDRYLLPHLGDSKEKRADKATYLADLMEDLFRVAFTNLTRDMSYQLERSISRGKELSIKQAVRSDVLTENIKHAIATGNWVGGRAGVSQLLDRTSYMGTLSHLRRVVSPLTRSQPHFEARDLHPTQFGKICPNETPEGPNCGLVKNLALMCNISEGSDEQQIKEIIKTMDVELI